MVAAAEELQQHPCALKPLQMLTTVGGELAGGTAERATIAMPSNARP